MNIKRSISTAAAVLVATAGLASPAGAFQSAGTISNGPVKPSVAWDYDAWKHCWTATYLQWRADGSSPTVSGYAADLTCGTQP